MIVHSQVPVVKNFALFCVVLCKLNFHFGLAVVLIKDQGSWKTLIKNMFVSSNLHPALYPGVIHHEYLSLTPSLYPELYLINHPSLNMIFLNVLCKEIK